VHITLIATREFFKRKIQSYLTYIRKMKLLFVWIVKSNPYIVAWTFCIFRTRYIIFLFKFQTWHAYTLLWRLFQTCCTCSVKFSPYIVDWCFRGVQSLWCKARWNSWQLLIKLWKLPQACCMSSVTEPKYHIDFFLNL
jgi:hypothetical protein